MNKHEEILAVLHSAAHNPARQVEEFKERTGKKVIGSFPYYTPEELVYAAGMLPIGLWGGQVEISEAKAYVPAFCCSIMQSCLELGLTGSYDELSGVIVPSMCDTLKCVAQNFKIGVSHLRLIQFCHPQMRHIEAGVNFLRAEYERVKKALEEISGTTITEEAISDAILIFNANRAALRRFTNLAQQHTDVISPALRHDVIKSGLFMERPAHTKHVNALCDALEALPVYNVGKRVVLTGILAEPNIMLDIFAENGISVVADDLAQETRRFRYDVPVDGGDALYRLAKWWDIFEGCSMAYDPDKKRIDMIIADAKKCKAGGVVVCMMKFCDPEEYDYPLLKKALATAEIPELYMEIDQQAEVNEQIRTRIQAFAELLNA